MDKKPKLTKPLREPKSQEARDKHMMSNPNRKWVKTPYGTFNSICEASRALKEFPTMIHYYCRKGKIQREKGIENDNSYYDYRGWEMEDAQRKVKRAIMTPDGPFESIAAAADFYEVSRPAICHKLKQNVKGFHYLTNEEYDSLMAEEQE